MPLGIQRFDAGISDSGSICGSPGSHQPATGGVLAAAQGAVEERADEAEEALLGRGVVLWDAHVHRVFFEAQGDAGVDDFGVKAVLVAEVVVDGGDVGVGAGADVAHGGFPEALLGEDFAGGFEEALAGLVGA